MKNSKTFLKKLVLVPTAFLFCACGFNTSNNTNENQNTEKEVYTVTFNINGAPGNNSSVQVEKGNLIGAKKVNLENKGYYFNYWCTDAECNNPYDFETPINSDLTLYASWDFHVFFVYQIGTSNYTTAIEDDYISVKKDHTLETVPECVIKNGDLFTGWYSNNNIPFDINEPITKPDLMYHAVFTELERTFNFYVGDTLIKTSTAGITQNWVDLPDNNTVFGEQTDLGFKGWYTAKEGGKRFNFEGFDVKKDNYLEETTNVYARFENLEGNKSLEDFANKNKNISYGAEITEGIGIYEGTYRIGLSSNSSPESYYGVAMYPTIFRGNLYKDNYVINLDLGEFSDSGITIQPRVYILEDNGDRQENGELYTKNSKAESKGQFIFALNDLKAGGDASFVWEGDKYFQIGLEYEQPTSMSKKGSIEVNSISISTFDNESVDLTENYIVDLENFWGGTCDKCLPQYDPNSNTLRLINVGTEHYGNYTYFREFNVSAGGQYSISVNVDSFSSKCIDGEKRLEIWAESSAFSNAQVVGVIHETGLATFDFSSLITSDCAIKFRFCFACADDCIEKIGYYTDEFVEISSISVLVDGNAFETKELDLRSFFANSLSENNISGTYAEGKYTISTLSASNYYGTIAVQQSWVIDDFEAGELEITLDSLTGECKMYVQIVVNEIAYYLDPQPNTSGTYTLLFNNAIDCELTGKQTIKFKFGIEDSNHDTPNSSYTISKLCFKLGD